MRIHRLRSHQELVNHRWRNAQHEQAQLRYVESFIPADGVSAFTVSGFSYPAREKVDFLVDFKYAATGRINWRERAICPITGLSNRMRATVHLFDIEMDVYPDTRIYLTEQVTPTYRYFAKTFENVCGSEFLGNKIKFGDTDQSGIRNENLFSLSFPEASFDAIISLDVLEHIPNFLDAFQECYRCLRPGGKLMWSAPFAPNSESNMVQTGQNENGDLII